MSEEYAKYGIERQRFLLDTDVLINHINKKSDVLLKLSEKKNKLFCISIITEYELYDGARTDKDRAIVKNAIRYFERYIIDQSIMDRAIELNGMGNLRDLGMGDLIIAATCKLHKLILVTENKKHFKTIPEIEIHEEEKTR